MNIKQMLFLIAFTSCFTIITNAIQPTKTSDPDYNYLQQLEKPYLYCACTHTLHPVDYNSLYGAGTKRLHSDDAQKKACSALESTLADIDNNKEGQIGTPEWHKDLLTRHNTDGSHLVDVIRTAIQLPPYDEMTSNQKRITMESLRSFCTLEKQLLENRKKTQAKKSWFFRK